MTPPDEASPRPVPEFIDRDLGGARFVRSNLAGAVMRAVDLAGADIDAPWLLDGESTLLVNGVDVAPLVEAELNRRFPGRADRRAADPEALRSAWARVEQAWSGAIERARTMPAGSVDVSVAGEWTFAQTLRHLVMATDVWFRRAILELDEPFHPIGQPNTEYETDGNDMSVFSAEEPSFEEVLAVRTERATMVRDFLATVTEGQLVQQRANPWAPQYPETVLSCLHTILEEEWEHLRFATRDLDAIEGGAGGPTEAAGSTPAAG